MYLHVRWQTEGQDTGLVADLLQLESGLVALKLSANQQLGMSDLSTEVPSLVVVLGNPLSV